MIRRTRQLHDEEAWQAAKLDSLSVLASSANGRLALIDQEIRRSAGNTTKIAALEKDRKAAKRQADNATRQFAASMLPMIAKQIYDKTDSWEMLMTQLNDSYGNAQAAPDSDNPQKQIRLISLSFAKEEKTKDYQDQMVSLLRIADPLRNQLLERIQQSDDDKTMNGVLARALSDKRDFSSFIGKRVAAYLVDLVKRTSSQ